MLVNWYIQGQGHPPRQHTQLSMSKKNTGRGSTPPAVLVEAAILRLRQTLGILYETVGKPENTRDAGRQQHARYMKSPHKVTNTSVT